METTTRSKSEGEFVKVILEKSFEKKVWHRPKLLTGSKIGFFGAFAQSTGPYESPTS